MAVHSPLILLIVILMAHIHVMNSTSSKKASLQEQEEKAQSPEKHLPVDPRMEDFNSLGDEIDAMVHRKVAGEKYAKDRMEKLSNLTTFLAKVPPIEEGEDESEVRLSPLEEMIKDVNMSAGEAHKFREEWEHASSRDSQVLLLAAYCDYLQGTMRRFFNKKRTDRDVEDDFWVVIFGLKKLGLDHLMEAVVKQRPELAGLDVKEQIREVASLMVDGHVGLHDWHLVLLKEAALGHNNPRAALHQEVVEKCGQVLHFYFIRKQMLVPSAAAAAAVVE